MSSFHSNRVTTRASDLLAEEDVSSPPYVAASCQQWLEFLQVLHASGLLNLEACQERLGVRPHLFGKVLKELLQPLAAYDIEIHRGFDQCCRQSLPHFFTLGRGKGVEQGRQNQG